MNTEIKIMSTAKEIRNHVETIKRGEPFTTKELLKLAPRTSIDKTLTRLVNKGIIKRITRGVFVRPKNSKYIPNVMPSASKVVEAIARNTGETVQVHGATAVNHFKLSTQVPAIPTFITSGPTREFRMGKLKIKLQHVSHRKLLHAGEPAGMALTALWHIGKNNISNHAFQNIEKKLSVKEFKALKNTDMPGWMMEALSKYEKQSAYA